MSVKRRNLIKYFKEYPKEISSRTTFKELTRNHDPYLIDPELLIYIEEDLGVYLPDEAVLAIAKRKNADVFAFINAILRYDV